MINTMTKYHGKKTCTTSLKQYLPETNHEITHTTIVEMLTKEDNLNETHTIQISTCHRFVSICFDTREALLKFTNTDQYVLPHTPIIFKPEY